MSSNTKTAYESDNLLIVFDLEKVPQQAMSGMSTHGGVNLTININGLGTSTATASRIDVIVWHDVFCECSDGSINISY